MRKMKKADALIKKWLKDESFRVAYANLEEEYALASALIRTRVHAGLSQNDLAKRMKTTQPAIARMEGGKQLPSTATLFKFAKATGTKLKISFVEDKH